MHLPDPFTVKVKPLAREDAVLSWDGAVLTVAVAAPADKNKANKRLVTFLGRALGRPVRIKSGERSSVKRLTFA